MESVKSIADPSNPTLTISKPVVKVKAKYYQADLFMNFVNGYSLEPAGVDISEYWIAVDAS